MVIDRVCSGLDDKDIFVSDGFPLPLRRIRLHGGTRTYCDSGFTVGCFEDDDFGTFEA
jgi:hypothetical protein